MRNVKGMSPVTYEELPGDIIEILSGTVPYPIGKYSSFEASTSLREDCWEYPPIAYNLSFTTATPRYDFGPAVDMPVVQLSFSGSYAKLAGVGITRAGDSP